MLLQTELERLRIQFKNSRPYHPQGRETAPDAQAIWPSRRTPLQAYCSRLKARPLGVSAKTRFRVREDRVEDTGKVSLRHAQGSMKSGIGRAHKGRVIKLLIADLNIRMIDSNGELIRELTLERSRVYQPLASR